MKQKIQHKIIFRSHLGILLVFLLLIIAMPIFGMGLSEYRASLEMAQADVDDLFNDIEQSKLGKGSLERHAEIVARLRKRLPPGAKVDMPGGTVEVDTRWLNSELDELSRRTNLSEKSGIVAGIKERLVAIEVRINELENAAIADRSKDEDKQKLAEIMKRPEYQKPEPPKESLIQRWIREFFEWLDQTFPKPQINAPESGGMSSLSFVLQVVLYGLLAIAIVFLVYKFAPFITGRFGQKRKSKRGDRVILGERISAETSASDLFADAEEMARNGELRLAIRKGYIALLCELSDRKVIGLARHKTNRDYLRDVKKRPQLFTSLASMTSVFERHWYGLKETDVGEWETFRETFVQAMSESSRP